MKRRTSKKSVSFGGQPSFKWQLQETTQATGPEEIVRINPTRRRHGWRILSVGVLIIILAGYWGGEMLMRRAEEEIAQADAEAAQAIAHENALRPSITGEESPTPKATKPQTIPLAEEFEIDSTLTVLEIAGTLALVDVVINSPAEPWHNAPYRVARMVRQGAEGWYPTTPRNTFWNERLSLETDYFHLDFSQRDAQAVHEIASSLDELYRRLHADLGLALNAPLERMTIRIAVVEGYPISVPDLRFRGSTLVIPPPELIARPTDLSTAETLRQAITFPLSIKMIAAAQEEFALPCTWQALGAGIGLWLRWDGHTLPSRSHWEFEQTINQSLASGNTPWLIDLLSDPGECWPVPILLALDEPVSERPIPRSELATTFVEYMVATFGRQLIPVLLREFSQSSDWDQLANSTVQLPADELERGWQSYLSTRVP